MRLADPVTDALVIYDGARDFISRMDHPECIATGDALIEALSFIITLPGFECWLDERDGKTVGGIGLLFSPPLWNRRIMGMTEIFIWASQDAPKMTFLRLLKTAARRKTEMGVTHTELVKLTSSPPGLDKIYSAMGLKKVQETWIGVG